MRRSLLFLLALLFINHVTAQSDSIIAIQTKNNELVYSVAQNHKIYQLYLGQKLNNNIELLKSDNEKHEIYIPFGGSDLFESAVRTVHNDGNPSLELLYSNCQVTKTDYNVTETVISLKDNQYPFDVNIHFKAYYSEDVIEQWVEIIHHEKKPLILFNFSSSMLHFHASAYWLTQFHSDWAQEMRMEESQLTSGIKVIDSKLGTRADLYQTPFFMIGLNNPA
jgi:alpha-galactosidase